jgi:hypothetical protein
MKRLKKFITVVLAAILTLTMAACAAKSASESEEETAIKRAKEIVDIVNTRDYEAIYNTFPEDTKKLTTVEGIKAAFQPTLDTLGAFVRYKSTEFLDFEKDGTRILDVYVETEYDNVTHIYEVSFDTDLNLIGFHTAS